MYRRHTGQVSMLESPEMFGSLPLDPKNEWIRMSKLVPWDEFDLKYQKNFESENGQAAIDSRIALGALLIKPAYRGISDEDLTKEIAMNPYLQYFLGLHEYRYECPFDPSMMTRFRKRITPEMLNWVNDQVIGRKAAEEKEETTTNDDPDDASALETISAVRYYLHRKQVDTVDYGGGKREWFELLPGRQGMTLRPALTRDGALIRKGLAVSPQ